MGEDEELVKGGKGGVRVEKRNLGERGKGERMERGWKERRREDGEKVERKKESDAS